MRAALSCFAVLAALAVGAADKAVAPGAQQAAAAFGRALVARDAGSLQPILPKEGRVHVMLTRMGPEDGRFGASQVVALFRDFLAAGKVSAFDMVRCECDGESSALAEGRAAIVDREGKTGRVGIHLAFEREGPRWVLREVKETPE